MNTDTRKFLLKFAPSVSAALTLTMEQREVGQKLDRIEAQKNFRYFTNILSQRAFQTAYRRHGRRIGVLPILEISPSGRLHYHAYLENPYTDLHDLKTEVSISWRKTRWGYGETDVQQIYSDNWLNYITKSGRFDDIDFENLHRV